MNFHPLRPFTELGKHDHTFDKVAEFNGLFSGVALYPQVFKAVISKNTDDLSIYTFLFIFVNSIIWILYARHRSLPQLLISSSLNCVAAGLLLFFIIFFKFI